jgi:hypothetical protein
MTFRTVRLIVPLVCLLTGASTVLVRKLALAKASRGKPSRTAPRARASATDGLVLTAALQDLSKSTELSTSSDADKKRLVLLHERTGMPDDLSFSSIENDLEGGEWAVPKAMLENLRLRNARMSSLRHIRLGKNILVTNLAAPRGFIDEAELDRRYPGWKAWVLTWLPGYSTERTKAVVRFDFGWSPHGASATYLLVRRKGKWKVQHREFHYRV